MQRIFIAFPVSGEAREEIIRVQNELKEQNKDLKVAWTKTDTTHVTLLFLGEIDGSSVAKIEGMLEREVQKGKSFSFSLNGYEVFAPNGIVVVRLASSNDTPEQLRETLQRACQNDRIPFDYKPFKPHVTLARNKWPVDLHGVDDIQVKPIVWEVNEVMLMESEAGRAGHEHKVLRRFSLVKNI